MAVTKADLKPGQAYAFLYCPVCNARYSADSGDYFMCPDDHEFECDHGDDGTPAEPMILATERRVITEV